jgi:hypothetical protein
MFDVIRDIKVSSLESKTETVTANTETGLKI